MQDSPLSPYVLAGKYFGGLAHIHTTLSNHPHHSESNLNITKLMTLLAKSLEADKAPLEFIMINEHSSDPDKPHPLGRLSLRGRRLLRERRRASMFGVPLLYGLEVSMLPNGKTDLTPRLADNCALVIASRHRLPSDQEHDPKHIMNLFSDMCANDSIDVLGHPLRYIDWVAGVDWKAIFEMAAESNTAVEVNLNTFPSPNEPEELRSYWKRWLRLLGRSGAPVFLGTDMHSDQHVQKFIDQWHGLHNIDAPTKLSNLVLALAESDIPPERVITSSRQRLESWISIDKPKRRRLS